ncbi:hypothetical protein BHM03_00025801 [Ensete ventricosum]|nr:hypothetical protein BHM03_00025801 [Ensete ventricosum]
MSLPQLNRPLGGAPQPPPPLPLFGDGNPPSRTLGLYWRLFNNPRLTPPPLNLGIPVWCDRLPLASIHSFDQLTREFEANLLASARPKPTAASLLGMRQKEDEHLGLYLTHFTKEIRVIPDVHPSLVIQAFMIEIRPSYLFWLLVEQPP